MTTLFGITTEKDEKHIVLASDSSATLTGWEDRGDVAIRKQTRQEQDKIWISNDRNLVVSLTGNCLDGWPDFLYDLLSGKINFERHLGKKSNPVFTELRKLNLSRVGNYDWSSKAVSSLMIATRYDGEPRLSVCLPLGGIANLRCDVLGSGSEHVRDHFMKNSLPVSRAMTLDQGIDYAVKAIEIGSQDLYTGGLNLVVVGESGIEDHTQKINGAIRDAKQKSIEDIKRVYSNQKGNSQGNE